MRKSLFAAALATLFAAGSAMAAEVIDIWPNGAPNKSTITEPERNDNGIFYNVTKAQMEVFRPAKPNGKAIIMMAGGGYGLEHLKMFYESFIPYYSKLGFTSYMLKYRLPKGNPEVPISDALEAVRIVKKLAAREGFTKVGVFGLSAGGHLAAWTSNACRKGECPDFSILLYPNITMIPELTQPRSSCRNNLIGKARSIKWDAKLSIERMVTTDTPPAFIAVSAHDEFAGSLGSMLYARAMVENGRPVAFHMYPTGNHAWTMEDNGEFPDIRNYEFDLRYWLETLDRKPAAR